MRTRTLLLLSLGCAIAILLAGGVMWWRVSNTPTSTTVPAGVAATVGAMRVTLEGAELDPTESGAGRESTFVVVVVLADGVDDDPADDFGVLIDGVKRPPMATNCPAIDRTEIRCEISFDGAGLDGGGGFLVYRRGDQQAAWVVP